MKKILTVVSALAVIVACDDSHKQNQEVAYNELKSFVDSIDTQLSADVNHNWDAINARYDRLEKNADNAYENATDEMKADIEGVEDRYENIRERYKNDSDELNQMANSKITELEDFMEDKGEDVEDNLENAGEGMRDGVDDSMKWLETNYNKLENSTQKKIDELKQKMNNDNV